MANDDKPNPGLVDDPLRGLTYKVIGLAMDVHNDLSPGYREETYHNAMTQKYVGAQVVAEREPKLPIVDENGNMVNFYRPDHRVEQRLLVEYKAHSHAITNDEIAQCLDYFAASDCEVLLIFNFGKPRLEGSACFRPSKFWLTGANVRHASRLSRFWGAANRLCRAQLPAFKLDPSGYHTTEADRWVGQFSTGVYLLPTRRPT